MPYDFPLVCPWVSSHWLLPRGQQNAWPAIVVGLAFSRISTALATSAAWTSLPHLRGPAAALVDAILAKLLECPRTC